MAKNEIDEQMVKQIIKKYFNNNLINLTESFLLHNHLKPKVINEISPINLAGPISKETTIEEATNDFLVSFNISNNVLSDEELKNKVIEFVESNRYSKQVLRAMNDIYDPEMTVFNIQTSIAKDISQNQKFKEAPFGFWLSKIKGVSDLQKLISLYQEPESQETWVNENVPEWRESRAMTSKVDKGIVTSVVNRGLIQRVNNEYESFLNEKKLDYKHVKPRNIPDLIIDEQTYLATNELISSKENKLTEDNLNDVVEEYLRENYTPAFIRKQIVYYFNESSTREQYEDEIASLLRTTEPYRNVNRGFWINQVGKVKSISELAEFNSENGIETFIEKYVPDWEEAIE